MTKTSEEYKACSVPKRAPHEKNKKNQDTFFSYSVISSLDTKKIMFSVTLRGQEEKERVGKGCPINKVYNL